jgi:hypothetical protein
MRSKTLVATICGALILLVFATSGATAAVSPATGAQPLTVDVTRMLYQCQMRGYDYTVAPGVTNSLKGYRSFELTPLSRTTAARR